MKSFLLVLFLITGLISCKSQSTGSIEGKLAEVENNVSYKGKKFPEEIGFVSDFENVFTLGEKIKLESKLDAYQLRTGRTIAIITIESIEPYEGIKEFAVDLSNEWGIGDKDQNNGLSIVFSKTMRQVRISTGLGTEKILTDEICQNIIDTIMLPQFKIGNYFEGMNKGLDAFVENWK